MHKSTSGFTIVELLITIIIIGILAAITIVSYNGIQTRANNTTVQADLRNSYTKIQVHATMTQKYPEWSSELPAVGLSVSKKSYRTTGYNFVYCAPYPYSTGTNFAIIGQSKSGTIFTYSNKGAAIYTGSWTMADYADICVDLTDENNVFVPGNHAGDPEFRVVSSGFEAGRTPQWATWTGAN